jgi:hypothetical protein
VLHATPHDRRREFTRSASLVDEASSPQAAIEQTGGKWNTYDITAKGPKMTIVLNGTRTVDVEDATHARGPIGLHYGAGTVKFRNVRIRTL